MRNNYPIKPRDLDTSEIPKGFEVLLDYSDLVILWAFVQFWQARGDWKPFTHTEFLAFIGDPKSKVNKSINSGVIWFIGNRLRYLLNCSVSEDDQKVWSYGPSHFVISTYFHSNPAKRLYG
jgi:hypothetical protein